MFYINKRYCKNKMELEKKNIVSKDLVFAYVCLMFESGLLL